MQVCDSDFFHFMDTIDDLTCKIWDVEKGKAKINLRLSSYGVSATWNPNNPMQVLQHSYNHTTRMCRNQYFSCTIEMHIGGWVYNPQL